MQTRRLLNAVILLSNILLIGCEINRTSEEGINPDVLKAKELVYTNHLLEAEQEILNIDTVVLDEINRGAYYLASAFLYHEKGNRTEAYLDSFEDESRKKFMENLIPK